MPTNKDEGPDTTSLAYNTMLPRWRLIGDLLGGTETMRASAGTNLPQYEEESDKSWRARRDMAVLLNITELTLDMLSGKPFQDPVTLQEDVPAPIVEWMEDVDMQGNNLDVFTRRWFREGLAKGFAHVMVDFPRPNLVEGRERTLADDRAENLRPYWVLIPPENVIFMSATIVNGREVLTHVRILEEEVIRIGWGEETVTRVRVLEPGGGQLWELRKVKGKKEEWVIVDEWVTTLDVIPMVTFYATREDLGLAKPPLLDLAYLNVTHWQSTSDQRNILSYARFPILATAGVDDQDDVMRLGPNQILATRDPQGKFYYVEHTGAAIKAGEEDLRALEDQMAAYGSQFLKDKPGDLKATVRALDTAEALSPLQAMTLVFKDAIETALDLTAQWSNQTTGGSVNIKSDFGLNDPNEEGWQAIEAARNRRDISREAFILEAQRRGWLSDDYDLEADKELITAEEDEALESMKRQMDLEAPEEEPEEEPEET